MEHATTITTPASNTNFYTEFSRYVTEHNCDIGLYVADIPKGVLKEIYLDAIPDALRQSYTCNACFKFINRYGRLVRYDAVGGKFKSAVWDLPAELLELTDIPQAFIALRDAVDTYAAVVRVSEFTGDMGTLSCGGFGHLHFNYTNKYAGVGLSNWHIKSVSNCWIRDFIVDGLQHKYWELFHTAVTNTISNRDVLMQLDRMNVLAKYISTVYDPVSVKNPNTVTNLVWHLVGGFKSGATSLHHFPSSALGRAWNKYLATDNLEHAIALLVEITGSLVHRRPTVEASANQITTSAKFLADNNWLPSLERELITRTELLELVPADDIIYNVFNDSDAPTETLADRLEQLVADKTNTTPKPTVVPGVVKVKLTEFFDLLRSGKVSGVYVQSEGNSLYLARRCPTAGAKSIYTADRTAYVDPITFVDTSRGKPVPQFSERQFGAVNAQGLVEIKAFVYNRDANQHAESALGIVDATQLPTTQSIPYGHVWTEYLCQELYPHRRTIAELTRANVKPRCNPAATMFVLDTESSAIPERWATLLVKIDNAVYTYEIYN